MTLRTFALTAILGVARIAAAQTPPDVFLHGVPAGESTGASIPLTLADAVRRGLANNLGAVLEAQRVRAAEGTRTRTLSDLLPHLSASVRQSDQVVNLAAFGFTGFPGIPQVIGPFGVFDARVAVEAPLFDPAALASYRSDSAALRAEQYTAANARDVVILVVANLYLQAVSGRARGDAARSQVATAETLYQLAQDQNAAGIVAGIDVLRQQVQLESARHRQILADNAYEKARLALARAIGLPLDQPFELTDQMAYAPAPPLTVDQAVAQAEARRADLKSAEARTDAARGARSAAAADRYPSLHVQADWGATGSRTGDTSSTYTLAASVRVPIFEGGATQGKVEQADAALRQREAELADLRAGIRYELTTALLDLNAADAAVSVARNAEDLARQQLQQAQDRFRAGIASTVELAQAQDALAAASETSINSVYSHNVAKAALARALGIVEERFAEFVGGER